MIDPIEIEQVGVAIGCGFYYSMRGHSKVKVKKANLIQNFAESLQQSLKTQDQSLFGSSGS